MIAVFYDRKHDREVTSDMLVPINLVGHYVRCEAADDAKRPKVSDLRNVPQTIGEIGYRSPSCPKGQNWDRWLMTGDLVFLRLAPEMKPVAGGGHEHK